MVAIIFDNETNEQLRFWEKVHKYGASGCWIWIAARKGIKGKEYGNFTVKRLGRWKQIGAHRLSFEYANGTIPSGLFVCHKCDNMLCVNPSHLFLGTVVDNNLDMKLKGRNKSGEQHWNVKLSDSQVKEIFVRSAGGESQYLIGESFGISQSHVSRILSGEIRAKQQDVDPYLVKALRGEAA